MKYSDSVKTNRNTILKYSVPVKRKRIWIINIPIPIRFLITPIRLIPNPKKNKLKKTPHSITSQCMGRCLGHIAAHMKDFIKNGSQIKILKIPQILMKISKYSILDHIYIYIYGTPQSKQSKTPERWRNFFLRPPLKIAQKCLSLQLFTYSY